MQMQSERTLVATKTWSRILRASIHSPMNSSELSSWLHTKQRHIVRKRRNVTGSERKTPRAHPALGEGSSVVRTSCSRCL